MDIVISETDRETYGRGTRGACSFSKVLENLPNFHNQSRDAQLKGPGGSDTFSTILVITTIGPTVKID